MADEGFLGRVRKLVAGSEALLSTLMAICLTSALVIRLRKFSLDNRAALNTMVAMALGFAVLITVVMVTNFIGVSIYSAIQPQLGGIEDTNVSKAITSTTYGTFKGLEIFGSMIQVIVVVLIAGIVLAVIIKSFGGDENKGNKGNSGGAV
ncbi:MAG: hypothetical protein QXN57_03205 [Desulfurococcaceae archaeon]